jgi:hypothetical protein
MKYAINALSLFLLLFAPVLWAKNKTILPDACGDDAVIFKVDDNANHPPLPALEPGKALIVVGHPRDTFGCVGGCYLLDTRIGMDGSWMGALNSTKSDYFAYAVTPGEHHFCTTFGMGKLMRDADRIRTLALNVEAGHIYYLEARNQLVQHGNTRLQSFSLDQLSDDDGKFMVKSRDYATSTPKK